MDELTFEQEKFLSYLRNYWRLGFDDEDFAFNTPNQLLNMLLNEALDVASASAPEEVQDAIAKLIADLP
jgi:hypothetical protein